MTEYAKVLTTLAGLAVMGFMPGLMVTAAVLVHKDSKIFKYYIENMEGERKGDSF